MKKIVIAGAGHGGLVTAKKLAENGYDVTVFEKSAREELGYDWVDCMWIKVFEECGIEKPDDSHFTPFMDMKYYPPSKKVELFSPKSHNSSTRYIDRKYLVNYLIDEAEKAGVKFEFSTPAVSVDTVGYTVRGINILKDGKTENVKADLVVDSCGIDSPLRKSLPREFGIMNEIPVEDTFSVYRVYFEKKGEKTKEPIYKIYFFHCGNAGMDWVIEEDDHYDVLVGAFGDLSEEDVVKAIADFKSEYPDMSDNVLRGGAFAKIPLRKTLPLIVCGGYALVGDSASMTEPLSGSGITKSMFAGRELADAVMRAKDEKLTVEKLWRYQYMYYKSNGESVLRDAVIKEALAGIEASDIDFLCENEIMTANEVSGALNYTAADIVKKLSLVKSPALVKLFAGALAKILKFPTVKSSMPREYDAEAVKKWMDLYETL